jgi:hypothetical protein
MARSRYLGVHGCSFSAACVFPGPVFRLEGSTRQFCGPHLRLMASGAPLRTAERSPAQHMRNLASRRGEPRRT